MVPPASKEDFMPRPRTPSTLSESLHQRLNSYALAASAAGVGVLALAQPAEGKIIYTKAHVVIRSASRDQYILDVNHDGVADFWFNASNWATKTSTSFAYMKFGRAPRGNTATKSGGIAPSTVRCAKG